MRLNTIIHGDCLEELKKFPEAGADLIFADPPYNLQLKRELYRPNNTKVEGVDEAWDKFSSFADYDAFCASWLGECRRVLKDTGTIWVIGSYHNIFRIGAIMLDLGYWILNDVIWRKTNPMPNFLGTRFTNATETLLWCARGERCRKYAFNHKLMKRYNGGKQMTSVWDMALCTGAERIRGADGKKAHSTQKPEELLKRVILSSSNRGDLVLDPFFGSGTTGAVAVRLGRNFIGIERDEEYIKIAQKRLERPGPPFSEAGWAEDRDERRTRVPFGQLLEEKLVRSGDLLYTPGRYNKSAVVLGDGRLRYGENTGSIHGIGALIQNSPSCNGWKFWHTRENGVCLPLDELRNEYLRRRGR
ncbi:MAG: site-specific DNA-methyltransferase [Desulfovibrio sp.]|nr:site-specific DNA-methyltransferase [Desulfovibrio sp.]